MYNYFLLPLSNYRGLVYYKTSKTRREIGNLTIDCKSNNTVLSADLESRYQGHGIGKKMYVTALKTLGKLSTKYHSISLDAQHVWDSLCKIYQYRTYFFKDRLTVYNKKKQ